MKLARNSGVRTRELVENESRIGNPPSDDGVRLRYTVDLGLEKP